MNKKTCRKYLISGKVQGVWYRVSTKKEAEARGITGWARNLEDGRVEVFAYGYPDDLISLHHWLLKGPELAQVDLCLVEEVSYHPHEGFTVR